jgi:hypothetical protein
VLLLIAFGIAVSGGRVVEAIIIGVLALPAIAFVVGWATGRLR